jgi:glycosyltransferase involved in cell wall biosynthesis
MRIGIVINATWNVYNFRLPLVKALLYENHEVVVFTPYDDTADELKKIGCRHRDIVMENKGANPLQDLKLISKYISLFKEEALDVVLSYTIKPNIYATIAAKYCRIPVLANVTGLGTVFLQKGFAPMFGKLGLRFALPLTHKVFFQNPDDHQTLVHAKYIRDSKTEILSGSGIDLEEFVPIEIPANHKFTFTMVARAIYDKGIIEYVEAAKILRGEGYDFEFRLLGALEPQKGLGVDKETVSQWEKLGLIRYFPHTRDVKPYIAQSDCIVLPSYREGTPRSLIEAASMAKPIITTDVPGCRETVIPNYNGLLCEVKSASDLAAKMKEIAALPAEKLKEMGKNSRKLAELKFDVRDHIKSYFQAIEQCTGKNLIQVTKNQTVEPDLV